MDRLDVDVDFGPAVSMNEKSPANRDSAQLIGENRSETIWSGGATIVRPRPRISVIRRIRTTAIILDEKTCGQ